MQYQKYQLAQLTRLPDTMEMYDNRNFSFFPVSHFAEDKKLVLFTMFSWNHVLLLSIVLLIKGKGFLTIQFSFLA